MKKYRPLLALLTVLISIVCTAQLPKKSKTLAAVAFSERINNTFNAQIIDVRTPEEFNVSHIENAKNTNWLGNDFDTKVEELDKNKPVYVYCKSGNRSSKAIKKLEELGFTTIFELEGGFLQWEAAGLNKPSVGPIGMSMEKYSKLLESEKIILINFTGTCDACQQMDSYIKKLSKELADRVHIITIDAEKNKTVVSELDIEALPTLIIYKNKNSTWRHDGFITEENLKKQLQ